MATFFIRNVKYYFFNYVLVRWLGNSLFLAPYVILLVGITFSNNNLLRIFDKLYFFNKPAGLLKKYNLGLHKQSI